MNIIKCKACNQVLFNGKDNRILNAHGNVRNDEKCLPCGHGEAGFGEPLLFISEDYIPEWIMISVNEGHWTRGKLNCPKCNKRVGHFDFVEKTRCACNNYEKPPVQLTLSKIDLIVKKE